MKQKQFLRGIVTCIAGLVLLIMMTACAGTIPGVSNASGNTLKITGSITAVDTTNNTVTLSANGQSYTVKGLTSQQVAALASQKGKVYTISVTQNSDGTYTISTGTQPTEATPGVTQGIETETPQANSTETTGPNEPGSIQFKGKVQQVSNNSIVVSMPSGQNLTMSIVSGQTDLEDFHNQLPAVGRLVKVKSVANTTDGSFTATKLSTADLTDSDLNVVQYQGVTTSAVGSDLVIHFKVGNQSFSFTIGANADLHDFNNNAQSIGSNQPVKVEVIFQGNNGTVDKVSNQ